jgi:ABC-type glutathione transport system ATPase component
VVDCSFSRTPNGAGKTTLIRMLLGLTPATAGTMRILGRDVPADRAEALARVGAIVEEPHFMAISPVGRTSRSSPRRGSARRTSGSAQRSNEPGSPIAPTRR